MLGVYIHSPTSVELGSFPKTKPQQFYTQASLSEATRGNPKSPLPPAPSSTFPHPSHRQRRPLDGGRLLLSLIILCPSISTFSSSIRLPYDLPAGAGIFGHGLSVGAPVMAWHGRTTCSVKPSLLLWSFKIQDRHSHETLRKE